MQKRSLFAVALLAAALAGSPGLLWAADEPPSVPPMKTAAPDVAAGKTASPMAPATAPAPAATDSATTGVAEVKPEVFYVRDKDNRLVPVPGFTYDDFIKYYRLKEQLDHPEVKPRFNLEQLTLVGSVNGDRIELTTTAKILTLDSEWVRIPLRMNTCALRESATYRGDGEEFLQFEANGDGYTVWLRGKARTEHELTLKLLLPLSASGGESRLDVTLPQAAASKLTLRTQTAGAVVTSSSGNITPEVTADGAGSLITALGAAGDFSLAWRRPDQPAPRRSTALEATGSIFVKIDGRSVASDATLTVRSFGADFDHFRIRLPTGAQLTGGQQPGYTLTAAGDAAAGLVDVKLDHKTSGPIEIRLLTERAYDVTKANENLELAGFAIQEAVPHRQWGHIAVAVSGDWQIVWGERTRVRQTDDLPEALRRKEVVASFEYFGQPSSLVARVTPRRTRVSVEPQYTYHVEAERTDLEARLKFNIRGARLFRLEVNMHGWEIDSVAPENLIDANSITIDSAGVTAIPLATTTTGELEVTIKAHRNHPIGAKLLEWTIPEPRVDVAGPAEISIIPADNVELTPQVDKLIGLSRSTGVTASGDAPLSAMYYRGENAAATFAAAFEVHTQSVTVQMETKATLQLQGLAVEQTLNYQIRYEPLDRLTLDVPRQLFDDRKLKFSIGGAALEAREVGEQPAADRRSVQIPLKQPSTGPVRLDVAYRAPLPSLAGQGSTPFDIGLVVPTDTKVLEQTAVVTPDSGIRIEQREGPWNAVDPARDATVSAAALRLSAAEPAPELRLALAVDERRTAESTFIDRAWIQTWLTPLVRQDRVVLKVVSEANRLRVVLPQGVPPSEVESRIDGKEASFAADSQGAIVVDLPVANGQQDHILELRYQFAGEEARSGRQTFEPPHFDKQVKLRRIYWQLVAPADLVLLSSADNLTPEFAWTWRDFGLGLDRVSFKEQRQLEQWVGLRTVGSGSPTDFAGDDPPPTTNRYLFSSIGGNGPFEVILIRRWLLLLMASLPALLVGLAITYLPVVRQPRLLLAAAAVLLLATIVWPEPMILFAQAASVGVGLALVAFGLRRMLLRAAAAEPSSRAIIPSRLERSSQWGSPRLEEVGKSPTTTASIAVVAAEDDFSEPAVDSGPQATQEFGGSTSRLRNR